jgi:hypothetical protein
MGLSSTVITSSATPQVFDPPFNKPMTRCWVIPVGNSFTSVDVFVQGQQFGLGSGVGLIFEQPGPITIVGTGDQVALVGEQSDNYQLRGELLTIVAGQGGGGGGGTTYTADGVTLQLTGTTFSIKNNGVGSAQLANAAVGVNQLSSAVAGAGLSGGSGSALAVNVDNSTVEIPVDTLQVKALGIGGAQLANGAVTAGKIDNQAVTYAKLGAGSERVPLASTGVCLDVAGQPIAGETISISVTDTTGTVSQSFEADGAGPFDFAIGASAADTLNNLVVAALAFFATSNSQLMIRPNAAGDYALLTVENSQPASVFALQVTIPVMTLTNYTKTDQTMLVMNQSRLRSSYTIPYLVSAADVGRGFFALRGDTSSAFSATATPPWLLARSTAGAMKPLGCTVGYDATLNAWVVTNNGTNDFANLDEILVLNLLDT